MVKSGWPPQAPRTDWLNLSTEPAVEPGLAIIDPHSHLWDSDDASRYLLPEIQADLKSGPNVLGTVFTECNFRYRADGLPELRAVGETEAVAELAEQAQPGEPQIFAIVGSADMELGAAVGDVLDAHIEAGRGRFRGIRCRATYDPAPDFRRAAPPDLLRHPTVLRGIRQLAARNLVLDLWLYHPQIPSAIELARTVPECTIVLGHAGGLLGVGPYAGRRAEILRSWSHDIAELATCPNVVMKIGGLGQLFYGYGFDELERPPTSDELARAWREPVLRCIEAFGPERCAFETNWPPDRLSSNYRTIWNAFKKLTVQLSPAERAWLFRDTAARVYSITY
jgi:L-fuconolactonase